MPRDPSSRSGTYYFASRDGKSGGTTSRSASRSRSNVASSGLRLRLLPGARLPAIAASVGPCQLIEPIRRNVAIYPSPVPTMRGRIRSSAPPLSAIIAYQARRRAEAAWNSARSSAEATTVAAKSGFSAQRNSEARQVKEPDLSVRPAVAITSR